MGDPVVEQFDATDERAVAERQQMEILVSRDHRAERLGAEERLIRIERAAFVDLGQPVPEHGAFDRQLVLGPDQIGRRRVDIGRDRAQLRVERVHRPFGEFGLPVEIGDFFGEVVDAPFELRHPRFELRPFGAYRV
jgi:hypothetical protein